MKKRIILILCITAFSVHKNTQALLSWEEKLELEGRLGEVLENELEDVRKNKQEAIEQIAEYQDDITRYKSAPATMRNSQNIDAQIAGLSKQISREKRKLSQLKRKEVNLENKLQALKAKEKSING